MEQTIELSHGDDVGEFPIEAIEERTSEHSGKALRRIRASAAGVGARADAKFRDALKAAEKDGWRGGDPETGSEKMWDIEIESYSITNNTDYSYELRIDEREVLQIEALVVDGMEMRPTRFEETVDSDGAVHIGAQVLVDDDTRDRLHELTVREGYFPVIRRGISDAPVEMRCGMCAWSQHDDGTKYLLALVDKRYDEPRRSSANIVELYRQNRTNTLVFRAELLEELLLRLVDKGIFTDAEIEAARAAAEARVPKRHRRLFQSTDVDLLDM